MYEVLRFRGGVYKFDLLSEFVEDVGGLILSREHFERIRGDYYLSTEVHVLLMIPENELKPLRSIVSEIKGISENLEINEEQKIHIFSYLSVYDALNRNKTWTDKENLKELMICPCYAMLCKNSDDEECLLENKLDEILEEMTFNEVIESKIDNDKIYYRLKKK